MRTGTFLCWLFGHKFIWYRCTDITGDIYTKTATPLDYCIRCGISKDKEKAC